ncbi:MAG: response regulator transcription factor [Bacteroidia bacterium]|nr:response regulator transcription factor [Bacteroidia bacterium]
MKEKERILLVDDDKSISEILDFNLRNEGFKVTTAYSAEEALSLDLKQFNLLLLDVMMGGISGYKLAEKLRTDEISIPIIFLTAKDTENDMLTGFSVGGDDYISKPFSIKEVIARIKAVLKRSNSTFPSQSNSIEIGAFLIDLELKKIHLNNVEIPLTKTELELLMLLAQNPDSLFSRERIINKIWKEAPYITERTVDVHVARLRKKLGDYKDIIANRAGYGYYFNSDIL